MFSSIKHQGRCAQGVTLLCMIGVALAVIVESAVTAPLVTRHARSVESQQQQQQQQQQLQQSEQHVATQFNQSNVDIACSSDSVVIPDQEAIAYVLGITSLNISIYRQDADNVGHGFRFLNLHENENTSVVAAKALLALKGGGSIVYLQHGGQRQITFQMEAAGVNYSFDPNRMFTTQGIAMSLSPYDPDAADAVAAFAQKVLDIYGFNEVDQVCVCVCVSHN
jgi:hypothetical protein